MRRVFWGVTESKHVVDIINQTDLTENIDGETKLGQPMVNFALVQSWGTIDVFALLGFRERRFFGPHSRPGLGIPVAIENPIYESGAGRRHIDFAVRWSHSLGAWDSASRTSKERAGTRASSRRSAAAQACSYPSRTSSIKQDSTSK